MAYSKRMSGFFNYSQIINYIFDIFQEYRIIILVYIYACITVELQVGDYGRRICMFVNGIKRTCMFVKGIKIICMVVKGILFSLLIHACACLHRKPAIWIICFSVQIIPVLECVLYRVNVLSYFFWSTKTAIILYSFKTELYDRKILKFIE